MLAVFGSAAFRAPGQAVRSGPVEARLAAEDSSMRPGSPLSVALILTIDTGWHVYWKNPGDSGLPTTLDWALPPGFRAGPIRWPVPERFVSEGLVTYGYAGQVLLMSEITPPESLPTGATLKLRARAGWLACRVECTPGSAALELSLPVGSTVLQRDSRWASLFAKTRSLLPLRDGTGTVFAAAGARQVTLALGGVALPQGSQALFYPDTPGQVEISAPPALSSNGGSLRLQLGLARGAGMPRRLTGLLVTKGSAGTQAFEIDAPVTPVRPGAGGFIAALLLAFVGGLILNLMPCVLPVISLKVVSFKGGARHGLLFALGVLVSFWIIAGVLVALRAGGHQLGWGFQFQDPVVVIVTGVLFFLIGLNLFGVFEVGTLLTRLGGVRRGTSGGGASFLSGMFATAVATPCTAPFMGVALGYALTHSMGESFGVFTALALGMAAPYLALSVVPGLGSRLPKPGPWMETFRQVMAFPMMAAAVWMVAVLAALSGAAAVILLLGAMLAAGMGAWVWGRWGVITRRGPVRAAAGSVAMLLAVGGTAAAALLLPTGASAPVESVRVDPSRIDQARLAAPRWEQWSQSRVDELRRQGTPVFLDFTAKWCLSCQVNEKVALDNPAVRKQFEQDGIATLRADWTDSNDAISRALAGFGRASVPLYVFYPRGGREPVILPELLTPATVLAAIGG